MLNRKLRQRLVLVIANSANILLVPVVNIAVSLLVIRLASAELWGAFVSILIWINLANHIIHWGSKEYLLREFSRRPGSIGEAWQSNLLSRAGLYALFVLAVLLFPIPPLHKLLVILWGGGVYNWFDPLTLIRAMAVVAEKVPEARLVFMGMKHPNPDVPAMAMANHSRELAEQLGLTGRHVFFNETWVPYQDRADLLLDADIGVSCHFDHIETEFSFRTRILDYLWAGLPIVCTQGDAFATLVETEGLGATAAPEDVLGLATALIDLLTDEPARAAASERVKEVAKRFTWRQSLAPLMAFMADPRRAPDLHPDTPRPHTPAGFVHRPKFGPRADLALFRTYLDQGGPGELVRRMTGRVRRIARETVSGR